MDAMKFYLNHRRQKTSSAYYAQLAIVASSQESRFVTLPPHEDVQVIVTYKTLCDPFSAIQQVQLLRIQIFDATGYEIFYYQELTAVADTSSGWNRYHGRDPGPPPPPYPPQQPFPSQQRFYQPIIAQVPVIYPSSLRP
ncbi:hypothetical protein OCU04_007821 [Sclerotinia nivalis]|uniref:Uncharacterized protein n=1 Tax=Sclerotinia nivalis TaxID=352851 RepID=A0A9X0DHR1_9HELO|nr:hypothetical protein OCU04_007821 [Sclerotinia nivalis]